MIYSEIIERVIQGVLRVHPEASRARLTMQIDAAFPQINDELSESFASEEESRALLRKNVSLVFVGGSIGIPSGVLKDYLKDATLVLSTGEIAGLVEPYVDFLRVRDGRLAWWAYSDLLISAKSSLANGGLAYTGPATLTCIASPDIPVLATDPFIAPEEFVTKFLAAMVGFITGQTANTSADESVK